MDAIRKLKGAIDGATTMEDEEAKVPLQYSETSEPSFYDSRSSEDTQRLRDHDQILFYQQKPLRTHFVNKITLFLATAVILLSASNILLLVNLARHQPASSGATSTTSQQQTTDCGQSVAEAKAKNCNWDELTKAWLPPECPLWGIDEYKREGMIYSPFTNTTGWDYYQDRNGTIQVNLLALAKDEERDPTTTLWTSQRQHYTHCAWSLKRILWTYENGLGHYNKISVAHHYNHCIDGMFRAAIRADEHVDQLTTTARVHFGTCTLRGE